MIFCCIEEKCLWDIIGLILTTSCHFLSHSLLFLFLYPSLSPYPSLPLFLYSLCPSISKCLSATSLPPPLYLSSIFSRQILFDIGQLHVLLLSQEWRQTKGCDISNRINCWEGMHVLLMHVLLNFFIHFLLNYILSNRLRLK